MNTAQLHLRKKIDELEYKWDQLSKKLSQIEKQRILENRVEEKLRMQQLIDEINNERTDIEEQMDRLENSLRNMKSIAILCPLFGASRIYYTELIDAIIKVTPKKYELLIVPIRDTAMKDPLISHFPQINTVEGLIIITCQVEGSDWLDEAANRDLPVVLLHDNISEDKAKGYTVISHIRPSLNALSDLVYHLREKHDCKNFSVVMVNPDNHAIRTAKLDIIERTIRDLRIEFNRERQLHPIDEYSHKEGVEIVNRIIERNPETDAIICLSDVTAIGVIQSLKERSLHNRIRVTGFDNVEVAKQNKLTTIDQNLRKTGRKAMVDLHKVIQQEKITEFQGFSEIKTKFICYKGPSCCFSS